MSTQYRTIQNSFIGGLLSALQEGAVGSSAYASGLSIAENVFYDTSSVFRRYGTKFGAMAKSADSVFFRYWKSEDEIYMLECWDKGARLISRDGKPASNEVVTSYLASELRTLSVVSNMGELYVVHRNHKPAKMTVTEPETEGNLLVLSEEGAISSLPAEVYGKDSNSILSGVMNAGRRPVEVQALFDQFYDTLQEEDYDKAKVELDAIEHLIGPDDPELTDARVTLALEQI